MVIGWEEATRRLAPYLDPAIGVAAVGLALVAHLRADVASIDPRLLAPDVVSVAATVVAAGALAWRRSRPVGSYAVMVAGCLVVSLTEHYIGLLSLLILVSLYSLAAHGRRRDGLAGLAAGVVCFVALALLDVPDLGTSVLLQSLAVLVAAWALGDAIRSRRQQQRDQVEAAVAEERLRIARELHDVVAHSMSLIAVQAGVGAHVIRTDVAAAEESLEVIADTSRRALEQTRSMLGLLRDAPDDGTRPPAQRLGDLVALVAGVRAAGLEVALAQPAVLPDLDAATSLAAYRIVQESLTNVIKHSAASTARVTVGVAADTLEIEVVDPGPLRPVRAAGVGARAARPAGARPAARRDLRGRRRRCRLPRGRRAAHGRPAVIRVAVVDDQELVRSGFVLLLRSAAGIEVVGEAGDGLEAIALCRRTSPDVVLMDVRMPHLDGLSATRTILADPSCAATRVVVLTTFDEDELVLEALRSGASGFLLKDTRPAQLLEAIEVVAAGEALLHPRVTRRLIERLAALPAPRRTPDDGLTDRERDVLLAVAQGLSNHEIAARLHLGYGTVKTHVSHLLTKLDCRDRAQLVMYAYETGHAVPGVS